MPAWPLVFIYMSDRKIRTLFVLREQMMIQAAFVEAARLGDCCPTRFRGSRSASPVKIFWGLAGVCLYFGPLIALNFCPSSSKVAMKSLTVSTLAVGNTDL